MGNLLLALCLIFPLFLNGQVNSKSAAENLAAAQALFDQKKTEEAVALLEAMAKLQAKLSKEQDVQRHHLLGLCHMRLQQFEAAERDYAWALEHVSDNDTLQAVFHSQLGKIRLSLSDYLSATNHTLIACDLFRKVYGAAHKNYTGTLNTLGFLYNLQAKYSEAEKTFLEAKQINQQITGGEDIQYARIINNLADVYSKLNRYEQAYELYQSSLRIKEKISGKQSRDYAKTLYNLADFQASLGRYEKAKTTIEEGITVYITLKDTNSVEYLKFLDYLAILNEQLGNAPEAERLYKTALARREAIGFTRQEDYGLNLLNLGNFYYEQKKSKEALPLVEQALTLIATIYEKNHPTYAAALTAIANIRNNLGQLALAKSNYEEAIRIIKNVRGQDHIDYFRAQFAYARFLRQTGQKGEAIRIYKEIYKIPASYLKRAACFLSEKELSEKMEEVRLFTKEIYSFIREFPDDHDLRVIAYNSTLYYRGFILFNLQKIRNGMLKTRQVSDVRDVLVSLHTQLENELNRPIKERGNVAAIEQKIMDTEIEISRKLSYFNNDDSKIRWKDVRKSLGKEEAALEYISFADPYAGDSIFYGALLLTSDAEEPIFIPLCWEADFASMLPADATRQGDYVRRIYDYSSRGVEPVRGKKSSLVDLIWSPVIQKLPGIKKVYVSPDGLLHRITLSALPTALESVVADSVELVIVGSTWQIVTNNSGMSDYTSRKSLVIGGLDYGLTTSDEVVSRGGAGRNWRALPWTEKEGQEVTKLLNGASHDVCYLDEKNARESIVYDSLENNLTGWRVLHIATHGYFSSKAPEAYEGNAGFYGAGMLNSGLVLSGINEAQDTIAAGDDGLLTAYSLSQLNLSQTELVVLSACETALGDIRDKEGVYGLQRAFKLAGAGNLIMSLWEVPDRETKTFMVTFYKHWLENKLSIREAFKKTQTEMREQFLDPYQWAGFILLE